LLVYGWNYYSHLRCLFKLKGKLKIIFRGDSTLLDESPGFKKILRRLFLKIVYRNVDFVLYVGTQNKKYFEVHGLKENQLVYGPHAIDNERFESTVCNKELLHSKLGIPVNEKILLFAGKFIEKKNPLLLLRTFCEENPVGWHLLMVGNGEKENELNSFAEGILNVHFMEFQNQKVLPCIYKAASAFILPSEGPEETWGLCINEAMACGLPVLVSRNCGCAIDLVDENENGFSFPPNEIRNGIRALFSLNDYDLKIMGEKSKVKIKEFNYQITINNLNKIINNS
jgi:glycosyltransferase involved in cell wall biosynthesis